MVTGHCGEQNGNHKDRGNEHAELRSDLNELTAG
jgi:hypothetical protein